MDIKLVTVRECLRWDSRVYYQIQKDGIVIAETIDKEAAENAYRLLTGQKEE